MIMDEWANSLQLTIAQHCLCLWHTHRCQCTSKVLQTRRDIGIEIVTHLTANYEPVHRSICFSLNIASYITNILKITTPIRLIFMVEGFFIALRLQIKASEIDQSMLA